MSEEIADTFVALDGAGQEFRNLEEGATLRIQIPQFEFGEMEMACDGLRNM